MVYHYEIPGEPIHKGPQKRCMDECHTSSRARWHVELERQHGGQPQISGPIAIELVFTMQMSHNCTKYFPTDTPKLSYFINFVLQTGTGIVFARNASVMRVIAEKSYGMGHPRTDIYVTELDEERKQANEQRKGA